MDNFDGLFSGLGEKVNQKFQKKNTKRTQNALAKSALGFQNGIM